jgi:hypothetical protein
MTASQATNSTSANATSANSTSANATSANATSANATAGTAGTSSVGKPSNLKKYGIPAVKIIGLIAVGAASGFYYQKVRSSKSAGKTGTLLT